MTEWVTQAHVAELVGCSPKAVEYAVAHGEIRHRSHHGPRPTVDLASALAWGEERQRIHTAAQARRDARPAPEPVGRLTSEGRLPATRHGHRWWVRRHHAEQYAAARAFAHRQRAA